MISYGYKDRIASILSSCEQRAKKDNIPSCSMIAATAIGRNSVKGIFTSMRPISESEARNLMFDASGHKLLPVAATFTASTEPDDSGNYFATMIAHRSTCLMKPYVADDPTVVQVSASAYLDQATNTTWTRQEVNGRDCLVRNNDEDIESVIQSIALTASSMRVNPDAFIISASVGDIVEFVAFDEKGVPFIASGTLVSEDTETNTFSLNCPVGKDKFVSKKVPCHAAVKAVPVEASVTRQEAFDFFYRAYGPKWKEIVEQTGAFSEEQVSK